MAYTKITGKFYNLNFLGTQLEKKENTIDNNSANSDVNYISVAFPGISKIEGNVFSTLEFNENDYILLNLKIPNSDKWLTKHNLLNFTPYFYKYLDQSVLASVDKTILIMNPNNLKKNVSNKICCTCSKVIANKFLRLGYTISYLPKEYINCATYFFFIRIGLIDTNTFADIPSSFTADYYKNNSTLKTDYIFQKEILESQLLTLPPLTSDINNIINNNFDKIKQIFKSSIEYILYPNLTNLYGNNFPLTSFYDSIKFFPYGNLQANNTSENYFNSNYINITPNSNKYYYLLSLNQKQVNCGLVSNVQLYNSKNKSVLLEYSTTSQLPSLNYSSYPYVIDDLTRYPLYYIYEINENDLSDKKIENIYLVERISYNPNNLNYTNYNYIQSTVVYYGDKINLNNLSETYDVKIVTL